MRGLRRVREQGALDTAGLSQHGLAGWIQSLLRDWPRRHEVQRRRLQLIETLPLGGKRNLMLVCCDGEHFLVGGGSESVETIARVNNSKSVGFTAKNRDDLCQ